MASWTSPKTWSVFERLTLAGLNTQLRDNLLHLFQRPLAQTVQTSGTAYSITSTSYVAVDATNLKLTLTPESGRVMIGLAGTIQANATLQMGLRVNIDNGARYEVWTDTGQVSATTQAIMFPPLVLTGLSVAQHTFELQAKVSANTLTIHRSAAAPLRFFVIEV